MFDYIKEAHVTLSPQWHPEKVAGSLFASRITTAVRDLEALDKDKKAIFYNRGEEHLLNSPFAKAMGEVQPDSYTAFMSHAMLGIATEAGELLEQLNNILFNPGEYDAINVMEELGDLMWYIAIACGQMGVSLEDVQRINIAKLRARFPDKFTEFDANNRDLFKEREILEDGNNAE